MKLTELIEEIEKLRKQRKGAFLALTVLAISIFAVAALQEMAKSLVSPKPTPVSTPPAPVITVSIPLPPVTSTASVTPAPSMTTIDPGTAEPITGEEIAAARAEGRRQGLQGLLHDRLSGKWCDLASPDKNAEIYKCHDENSCLNLKKCIPAQSEYYYLTYHDPKEATELAFPACFLTQKACLADEKRQGANLRTSFHAYSH